jgi:hypothetical protein
MFMIQTPLKLTLIPPGSSNTISTGRRDRHRAPIGHRQFENPFDGL